MHNNSDGEKRSCRLCGGATLAKNTRGLIQCGSCGFIMDARIWDNLSNSKLEEQWFEENPSNNNSFWTRSFQRLNNRRTLSSIRAGTSLLRGRLLEIGVGNGSLLAHLKSRGFTVEGCDLSKAICNNVQGLYGILMHHCPVSDIDKVVPYHAIVMNHVLEHVNDPLTFLANVQQLLSSDGIVRIAVPNVDSWEAMLPGWGSYEPYHLSYFTPKTLKLFLEKSGFIVLKISTHDSFSGWFLALLRTLLNTNQQSGDARHAQRQQRRVSWVRHAYYLAMVAVGIITLPLRWAQILLGHGDEIVAIARTKR